MLKLRKLRIHAGFTQAHMASKLGIAKSTYNELENGKSNPSWGLAQKMSGLFGLPAEDLLAEDSESA